MWVYNYLHGNNISKLRLIIKSNLAKTMCLHPPVSSSNITRYTHITHGSELSDWTRKYWRSVTCDFLIG